VHRGAGPGGLLSSRPVIRPRPAALLLLALLAPGVRARQDGSRLDAVQRQVTGLAEDHRALHELALDGPLAERLDLDYGVALRLLALQLEDDIGHARTLRSESARLYLRAELDGTQRAFARLRYEYLDWRKGDSLDGRGDRWEDPVLDRAWYEVATRPDWTSGAARLKVGRQFVEWGDGLTLSNVLDAGRIETRTGDWTFSGLVGATVRDEVVDFDGTRPDFDRDTRRFVIGTRLLYEGARHRPYLLFLSQCDRNDKGPYPELDDFGRDAPTLVQTHSRYAGLGITGSLGVAVRYRLEGVLEWGRTWSDPRDDRGLAARPTRDRIRAHAAHAGLTWLLRDRRDSRFDLDLLAGSGDADRRDAHDTFGGNRRNTPDRSFNSLGFVYTGLALAPQIANLHAVQASFSSAPWADGPASLRRLRLGLDGFAFAKADPDAPMGFATLDRRWIGAEVDGILDWTVLSDLTVNLRLGLFLPGDALPPGTDDPRTFLLAGVTYAF